MTKKQRIAELERKVKELERKAREPTVIVLAPVVAPVVVPEPAYPRWRRYAPWRPYWGTTGDLLEPGSPIVLCGTAGATASPLNLGFPSVIEPDGTITSLL